MKDREVFPSHGIRISRYRHVDRASHPDCSNAVSLSYRFGLMLRFTPKTSSLSTMVQLLPG